ncbi:MAG: hypothetical protein KJ901_25795 [Gammaproteobacteria bacterium]|nr:hypothetical protein [Gammaproteobacteria bacterium]
MILIGLSILAAIGLLVLIVWALHRNQRIENQESVDRNLPLPPIELKQSDANELSDVEDMLGIEPESSPAPRPAPVAAKVELSDSVASPDQWLVRSRECASQGDFEAALQLCESALPQMGAFRQSCVVLRAQIRELKKKRHSHSHALEQLYQLAAQADFFHGKTPNTKALAPSAVKQIDYAAWKALSSPYAVLGYKHVSLLTKTDAKWLVQEWGEPESHGYMRELHLAQWNTL